MTDTIDEDIVAGESLHSVQASLRRVKAATKADRVTKILARARGATLSDIVTETGWQQHSARAFLSGLRKRGTVLVKEERKTGETSCRIDKAGLDC